MTDHEADPLQGADPSHQATQARLVGRRTVLTGASALGLAALGAGALAACSAAGGAGTSAGPVTVKKADVPVGGGVIETKDGVVVVQPTSGSFKAYSAICPHQGCPVDRIADGTIQCPCHGSTFRVSDGSVVTGPAAQGLTSLTATVQGDSVVVT